jgi:hypothetical protein
MGLATYEEAYRSQRQMLKEAGVELRLCAGTVVRTWADEHFGSWFNEVGMNWESSFSHGEQMDEFDLLLDLHAAEIDHDIKLHWCFEQSDAERRIATMFKLAFGGIA